MKNPRKNKTNARAQENIIEPLCRLTKINFSTLIHRSVHNSVK